MPATNRYLNELIDYGLIPHTRAEAILDMQQRGINQPCIDRWLQGNEHAQPLRDRRAQVTTRLYLQIDSSTREKSIHL